MLYDVVCKKRGKEEIVFTGELPKVKDYIELMRSSQRGMKQEYSYRPSSSTEKYKKKPNNHRGD